MTETRYQRRRSARWPALVVAFTLLAGCTGAGSSASPDESAVGGESTAPSQGSPSSDEPIRIGVAIGQSGQYQATAEGLINAYNLWAKHTNEGEGLLGRPVEFIYYDDQGDPATGARLYERLITEDQVDLVFGPFSSSIVSAVAPVLEEHGYPMLTPGASAADIWAQGWNYVFGMYSGGVKQTRGFLEFAEAQGVETLAVVNEASPFGQDVGDAAAELAEEYGIELTFQEEFPPLPTDLSGILLQVRSASPDMLIGGTYYDESVLLARQANELGLEVPYIATTIGPDTADFVEALGDSAEGFIGSAEFSVKLETPGAAEFVAAYEAEYGIEPTYQAAMAYASGQIMQEALENSGSLDLEALREELLRLETVTVAGTYEVDERGFQVGKESFVIQVINGEREVVWPPEYASADPISR